MKKLERKILETLAMHAKKLRECKEKWIKPGRGNEKTSRSLLLKGLIGHGRVIGGLDFWGSLLDPWSKCSLFPKNPWSGLPEGEQAIHVPMGEDGGSWVISQDDSCFFIGEMPAALRGYNNGGEKPKMDMKNFRKGKQSWARLS